MNEIMEQNNGFEGLAEFDLGALFADELGDMDVSFDRIGTPGSGGNCFEVPGENPGETDSVKEFTGVILYHHAVNFYYMDAYNGMKNDPTCSSRDGMWGIGTPGGDCKSCPLNQFGTGANGGKACRNKRRVYLIREGEMIPVLLTLPTGSLRVFADYVKRLLAKGRKPSGVMTRFSIVRSQGKGPAYAQVQCRMERVLTEKEREAVSNMARQVKEIVQRNELRIDETEMVDAETGEIRG